MGCVRSTPLWPPKSKLLARRISRGTVAETGRCLLARDGTRPLGMRLKNRGNDRTGLKLIDRGNLIPLFRADWSARHRLSLHLDLYDMQSLIPRRCLQYSQRSLFTSAVLNQSHYETLGVPRNASTKQVKATFYKVWSAEALSGLQG